MQAPAAHASSRMDIGIQDDAALLSSWGPERQAAYDRAADLGVTSVRANMIWSRVLPAHEASRRTKPATLHYDFTAFDALIADAHARDMRVQLTLTGPAPAWASKSHKVSPLDPSVKEYARFVTLVAKHFRGQVQRYSIWNEPNWHGWLGPARTAASQYRALYRAGYSAIKRTDRDAEVIFGELAPQKRGNSSFAPLSFVRSVLCVDERWHKRKSCATIRTDGVALHPYYYLHAPNATNIPRDDVTLGTLSRLTSALTK